jgi:RNA polymerase sigma-70 factor (ECF subfamily)
MSDKQPTSLTLLERARANDSAAWERLLQLYRPLVLHWCLRSGVSGPDAEDVVQEVFGAVVSGLGRFRREQASDTFRGWLRGITRNKLLHHHERRRAQPIAQGGTEANRRFQEHPTPTLDDSDSPDEERALYRRALELLRNEFEPIHWQAFWRTAVDGLNASAVAAELGIKSAAVRQAKSRVLRRLREEMGDVLE